MPTPPPPGRPDRLPPEPSAGRPAGPPGTHAESWRYAEEPPPFVPPAPPPRRGAQSVGAVVALALWGLLVGAVTFVGIEAFRSALVSELEPGECLVSSDIERAHPQVDRIRVVRCDREHDAEVVGTVVLQAELADDWADRPGDAACRAALDLAGLSLSGLAEQDLELRPLVQAPGAKEGGTLACLARDGTGDVLTEPLTDLLL